MKKARKNCSLEFRYAVQWQDKSNTAEKFSGREFYNISWAYRTKTFPPVPFSSKINLFSLFCYLMSGTLLLKIP